MFDSTNQTTKRISGLDILALASAAVFGAVVVLGLALVFGGIGTSSADRVAAAPAVPPLEEPELGEWTWEGPEFTFGHMYRE